MIRAQPRANSQQSAALWVSSVAGILVFAIGLAVIAARLLGLPPLVIGPVAMEVTTAIGCVLAGSALWLLRAAGPLNRNRLLLRALLGALIALAALSLAQDLGSGDIGLHQLLFPQAAGVDAPAYPGRMAPSTALCFILFATAALLLTARPGSGRARARGLLAVECAGLLVAAVATLTLISHAVGMPVNIRWRAIAPMAAPTALAFLLLASGLIMAALREEGHWVIGKWVTAALLGSLLLTLLVNGVSASTAINMQQTHRWLVHTHEVRLHNSQLLAALVQIDAAQRGFVLTGEVALLAAQPAALRTVVREVAMLQRLTADNRGQQERLRSLQYAIAGRLNYLSETLRTYDQQSHAIAAKRIRSGGPRAYMSRIRSLVHEIDAEEARLTAVRQAELALTVEGMFALLPIGGLLSLLVLSGGLLFLNRQAGERRRAEQERDRFFSLSPDLLCIADVDGYFKRLSPAFTTTLGWSLEELLARPFEEFLHPDDIAATRTDIAELSVPGASARPFENRMRHRDGSWRLLSWKSVIEPNGRIHSSGRDITQQRAAQDEVVALAARQRDSEAQIRLLLDSTGEAIYGIDADGHCTFSNPACARLLGYHDSQELLGKDMHSLIHYALADGTPHPVGDCRIYQAVQANTASHVDDEVFWRADGSSFAAEYRSSPIYREGELAGAVVTFMDISERKRAEASIQALNADLLANARQLAQSNGELESFSYSVSHDLRAPLRHIDGYARMLSEDAADRLSPEMLRFLQTIIDSARRMGVLIDDLLAFSRLGRKPVTLQQVNMHDLAAHAADEARNDGNRQARIEIGELPQAAGDPALLRQVWTNLISNALKYSTPRGDQAHIVVSGELKGDRLHYQVRDNGVGFDMRYAGKLFGVFQRLHGQDEFEGTGVGLAIVQRIVQRHGGQVSASSELDHGAIFSFDLPTSEASA